MQKHNYGTAILAGFEYLLRKVPRGFCYWPRACGVHGMLETL